MDLHKHIFDGEFGLERETLRVTADGAMAQTPHPFPDDKYLDRDFCENQLELITPVCESAEALMAALGMLHKKACDKLAEQNEYLWLSSNPPHIETEKDIQIARYSEEKMFKHNYRLSLERRYGKRLMLYSGIHLNLSFSEKLIKSLGDKDKVYFRLFKQVSRYSWLLLLLSAASPIYDKSFDGDYLSCSGFDGYASRRSGDKGYWNQFIPELDYTDIHSYAQSVRNYVDKGALISASELYLPVRLKPRGANSLDSLEKNGANHIELRMYDLNPLAPLGIFKEDIEFAYYFLLYLTSLPDFDFTLEMQKTAIENHKSAALYDLEKIKIDGGSGKEKALEILDGMAEYFSGFDFVLENIVMQRAKLTENKRYCVKVYEEYRDDFQNKMLSSLNRGRATAAKGDGVNV